MKEIENMFKVEMKLLPIEGFNPTTTDYRVCSFFLYLDMMTNKLMSKQAQEEFCRNFKKLYNEAYGKRKGDSANRKYSIRAINNIFNERRFPYQLYSDMVNFWILKEY